jgi:VanZ family protein
LSAQEFSDPSPFPINDKVAHFVLYSVLGGALAFGRSWASRSPGHLLLLATGLLYAISDEIHQSFVPSRTPSAGDLVADALGLAVGYAGVVAVARRRGPGR